MLTLNHILYDLWQVDYHIFFLMKMMIVSVIVYDFEIEVVW